jgi:hypothetical protein
LATSETKLKKGVSTFFKPETSGVGGIAMNFLPLDLFFSLPNPTSATLSQHC